MKSYARGGSLRAGSYLQGCMTALAQNRAPGGALHQALPSCQAALPSGGPSRSFQRTPPRSPSGLGRGPRAADEPARSFPPKSPQGGLQPQALLRHRVRVHQGGLQGTGMGPATLTTGPLPPPAIWEPRRQNCVLWPQAEMCSQHQRSESQEILGKLLPPPAHGPREGSRPIRIARAKDTMHLRHAVRTQKPLQFRGFVCH